MKLRSALILFVLCAVIASCAPAPTIGQTIQPDASILVQNSTGTEVVLESTFIPAGDVIPIPVAQLLNYLMLVITGQPGTFILKSADGYLFAFQMANDTWGWLAINPGGSRIITSSLLKAGGNQANPGTFKDLVKYLLDNGWKRILPDELPLWIKTAFADIAMYAKCFGKFMLAVPALIILPAGGDMQLMFPGTLKG